jgi:hypothetical protein
LAMEQAGAMERVIFTGERERDDMLATIPAPKPPKRSERRTVLR